MQAIRAIVDTYVRLRKEDALLAAKQQRLRVLAMCDADNPMFERLRSQCLEEIAEIEAGLERLRPAPLLPDLPPSPPEVEGASDPVSSLPANISSSRAAADDPPASPTPIDPSPFLAVEKLPPPVTSSPSPVRAASDFATRSASTAPPQFLDAVSPSLLASTILAGSISSKLPARSAKLDAELMRLQIAVEKLMRSQD